MLCRLNPWCLLAHGALETGKAQLGQVHPRTTLLAATRGPGVLFPTSWQQVNGVPGTRQALGAHFSEHVARWFSTTPILEVTLRLWL
jgi:hypothetical protein